MCSWVRFRFTGSCGSWLTGKEAKQTYKREEMGDPRGSIWTVDVNFHALQSSRG